MCLLAGGCAAPAGKPLADAGLADAGLADAPIAQAAGEGLGVASLDSDPAEGPTELGGLPSDNLPAVGAIRKGNSDRILLIGHVIGPGADYFGAVLVQGTKIVCVGPDTVCTSDPAAIGATVVNTGGILTAGLIDTHNHILFDIFNNDDWLPAQTYQDHTQWPMEDRYGEMLDIKQCLENASQGKPDWCAKTSYGSAPGHVKCEMDKWGELKGLIAGTTSIVGLPGTAAACFGSLARSVDTAHNGLGVDKIQTSAIFPPSQAAADGVCQNMASGATSAYLVHVGEGINDKALAEFATLGKASSNPECLYAAGTTITHGTAFGAAEFAKMAKANMKLTWSPASNFALYGSTTNIPLARAAGVTVALAPDWSMGGSQNMLDELRFADSWDNKHWNDTLTAKDLLDMATSDAAAAIGLGQTLGRLQVGYMADLVVFAGSAAQPYQAVLAARPQQVKLVMVGGVVLYGDVAWQALGPSAPGCEVLPVCGSSKFVCAATTDSSNKLNQTVATIEAVLQQAMLDVDAQTPNDGFTFAPVAPLVDCK